MKHILTNRYTWKSLYYFSRLLTYWSWMRKIDFGVIDISWNTSTLFVLCIRFFVVIKAMCSTTAADIAPSTTDTKDKLYYKHKTIIITGYRGWWWVPLVIVTVVVVAVVVVVADRARTRLLYTVYTMIIIYIYFHKHNNITINCNYCALPL